MQRVILLIAVALFAGGLGQPGSAHAQAQGQPQGARRCFNVPGITNCVEGRFRQYWEQNGGLPVFGYPISPPAMYRTEEGSILVQTFERARFELHPNSPPPYDVLLTRLGFETLKLQGRNPDTFPKVQQQPNCLFFAQTGHNVCNQEAGNGFRSYWESHGLQDPKLNMFGRSLALFGLPLSEATLEKNAAGMMVMTQWFERARFEFYPANPRQSKVLLGLLGNETLAALPPPGGSCADIPAPVASTISPSCAKLGSAFTVEVAGFAPNQELSYWITDEPGFMIAAPKIVRADAQGHFKVSVDTRNFSGVSLKPGNYTFVARDLDETLLPASAPFRVIP